MTDKEKIAQDIIHEIAGTCKSLDPILEEKGVQDDVEILGQIDDEVFCCSCCDWWCFIEEMSEDGETCTDCEGENG